VTLPVAPDPPAPPESAAGPSSAAPPQRESARLTVAQVAERVSAPPAHAGGSGLVAALDQVVRVVGGVLAVVLALLTGLLELILAPLRVSGHLVGLSALLVVPVNIALAWFAVAAVGRKGAVALPWVTWTLLMFVAAGMRTDEGDYLLAGDNWVGMAMILFGSVAFAGYLYRLILRVPPRT
jgi:hypothetical protein